MCRVGIGLRQRNSAGCRESAYSRAYRVTASSESSWLSLLLFSPLPPLLVSYDVPFTRNRVSQAFSAHLFAASHRSDAPRPLSDRISRLCRGRVVLCLEYVVWGEDSVGLCQAAYVTVIY